MAADETHTNAASTSGHGDSSTARVPAVKAEVANFGTVQDYLRQIKIIENRIQRTEDESKEINDRIKEGLRDAEESLKSKIAELKNDQINVIQTLSIFVAFFTFVSVEFKVLTSSASNTGHVAGFTLILLGALIFFVLLIDFVLNTKLDIKKTIFHEPKANLSRTVRHFSGYTENIEFEMFTPSTWGDGFKMKFLPLFILSILLIVLGIGLVSVPVENQPDSSEAKTDSLNIKNDLNVKVSSFGSSTQASSSVSNF